MSTASEALYNVIREHATSVATAIDAKDCIGTAFSDSKMSVDELIKVRSATLTHVYRDNPDIHRVQVKCVDAAGRNTFKNVYFWDPKQQSKRMIQTRRTRKTSRKGNGTAVLQAHAVAPTATKAQIDSAFEKQNFPSISKTPAKAIPEITKYSVDGRTAYGVGSDRNLYSSLTDLITKHNLPLEDLLKSLIK
jgi:hypothetical protein